MSIRLSITPRTLHFKQPAGTSRGVYTTRQSWFVTATDDARPGVQGVGECAPLPDLSCDASPEYEERLHELCRIVEQQGDICYDALRPYPSVLFGLETALLDLERGGTGVLFDNSFARGETGIPINGLVWMGNYEEMLQRLEEKMRAGFRCVKLKIGAIDFDRELALVRHIRSAFTPTADSLPTVRCSVSNSLRSTTSTLSSSRFASTNGLRWRRCARLRRYLSRSTRSLSA